MLQVPELVVWKFAFLANVQKDKLFCFLFFCGAEVGPQYHILNNKVLRAEGREFKMWIKLGL